MDFRFALRMLLRAPGFTAVAILTLGLGIGVNTVVFTLYDAVAHKPIAARAPRELVRVTATRDLRRIDAFSWSQVEQIRGAQSLWSVIATSSLQTVAGRNEVLRARIVTQNYFDALGVRPFLGRTFAPGDSEAAVVSYEYWAGKLQRDPNVLNRTLRLQNATLQIVGVAPAEFAGTGLPPRMPDLWIPVAAQAAVLPGVDWVRSDRAESFQVLGRLRPGVPAQQASAELEVIGRGFPLVNNKPAIVSARGATFFQADSGEFETFAQVCLVLLVAVGLILLIGSINLINLLFARNAVREQEFAVRLALGAGRWRVARMLCTESLVMGALGGGLGMLFSLWACEWIRAAVVRTTDRVTAGVLGLHLDIAPDWRVFAYTAAVSALTGIAIGIWPAVRASAGGIGASLKLGFAGSRGHRRKRSFLISAQVAACLMLLAGAGLLFRGIVASRTVDPGFDARHALLIGVDARSVAGTPEAQRQVIDRAIARFRILPGVSFVSWADRPPFLGHGTGDFVNDQGRQIPCLFNFVSSSYFDALGIGLLEGRTFTADEIDHQAPVVIISDVAAREAWPGRDPIGRTVNQLDWLAGQNWPHKRATVIGVVKGVRSTYLSKPDEPFLYLPRPMGAGFGSILIHAANTDAASRAVLAELGAIDPNLPSQSFVVPIDGAPMEIQRLMAQAPAAVAFGLGGVALLLAAVGVFGLVSQLVAQRTREIAIRVSLGAQNRDVARMVLWETVRPVLAGSILGLAGAIGLSVLLHSFVRVPDMPDLTYGAGAFDPWTFTATLVILAVAVLAATGMPVRRATRIAPAEALRNE